MRPVEPQRGSSLIVALVMLVLLTLIAVSAINSTSSSIQVVGNSQFHDEAGAVAQQAIEQVISSNFTIAPASSVISVDINDDGVIDYAGQVNAPTCTSSIPLTNSQLDPTNSADQNCLSSGQLTSTGIVGASGVMPATQSWCAKQTWDIQASVSASNTGASTVVHQGVFLRVPTGTVCL
ncbi:MAG: putative transmembrane protein [Candidatus Gallionella acididurans]|uniref:Putative transmembrane protein n=1 Tax=Candidatus Gallionella acididurans TaxID=1796491 RepID=A0A139BPZ9_9PROT|nr:MAG: putative transmembrane protein [Candidatus Gallionella acididurans]